MSTSLHLYLELDINTISSSSPTPLVVIVGSFFEVVVSFGVAALECLNVTHLLMAYVFFLGAIKFCVSSSPNSITSFYTLHFCFSLQHLASNLKKTRVPSLKIQ